MEKRSKKILEKKEIIKKNNAMYHFFTTWSDLEVFFFCTRAS